MTDPNCYAEAMERGHRLHRHALACQAAGNHEGEEWAFQLGRTRFLQAASMATTQAYFMTASEMAEACEERR